MSKLTDSEGEYWPADDERDPKATTTNASSNLGRLQSFLDSLGSDDSGFFFDEEEQPTGGRVKNYKVQRDLAEGQNLNNSFGCYSPEDWEHLHVDKGHNPQFKVLQQGSMPAKPKVQLPGGSEEDAYF